MPTQYTGDETAIQSPSPAPAPGVAPILNLPVDGDARNTASIYQPFKVLADFLAGLYKALNIRKPIIPSAGTGFSAPVHTGTGTGSVTASALPTVSTTPTNRIVVKIVVGGAVATATFAVSLDNGTTYGSTQTTAATVTDASGIKFSFSGTFTANDLYAFTPADTPQLLIKDAGGNTRWGVDHNGYPIVGRRTEFREMWPVNVGASQTANPITNYPQWNIVIGGAANYSGLAASSTYPQSTLQLNPGTVNATDKCFVYLSNTVTHAAFTALDFVAEWEHSISIVGTGTNVIYYAGLTNGTDPTLALPGGLYFLKRSTDTNWQAVSDNLTTQTIVDTGIAPVATTMNLFRIELHGSASAWGTQTARYFIDGKLVAVITTNMPTFALRWLFGGYVSGGSASSQRMNVGAIASIHNRFASAPTL